MAVQWHRAGRRASGTPEVPLGRTRASGRIGLPHATVNSCSRLLARGLAIGVIEIDFTTSRRFHLRRLPRTAPTMALPRRVATERISDLVNASP